MAIAIQPSRRNRRAAALLTVACIAAISGLLTIARPVFACSCVAARSMKDYATPENAIFTGMAGGAEARGVPVQVDRWIWGRGAAPVVWLAASSFGDSAACGITPPRRGTSWLWITWLADDRRDFGTGLCSPSGDLATPEGQAMLADAMTVFHAIAPPEQTPAPTDGGGGPAPTPSPAEAARDAIGLNIAIVLVAASLAMFGALALVARRSPRRPDRS